MRLKRLHNSVTEETARRNLRQVLSRELRPAFGDWLESDTDTVWLNPLTQTDVAEFEAKLEVGKLTEALALYRVHCSRALVSRATPSASRC
ncbi:MAG: hypothetical protein SFU83_22225 [Meiothermus sp.]|nr:hypothetical protein [Meiothermus sp.]